MGVLIGKDFPNMFGHESLSNVIRKYNKSLFSSILNSLIFCLFIDNIVEPFNRYTSGMIYLDIFISKQLIWVRPYCENNLYSSTEENTNNSPYGMVCCLLMSSHFTSHIKMLFETFGNIHLNL